MISTSNYLTGQYNDWLKNGGIIDPVAAKTVHMVLLRSRNTNSDGQGRIRPSLIGDCIRKQILSYDGVPQSDKHSLATLRNFQYGHSVHQHWQEVGLSVGFLTAVEVPLSVPEWNMAGSADGVVDDGTVFELKTCSSTTFGIVKENAAPLSSHQAQVQAYMKALDAPGARIVYVHKEDWRTQEFHVERSLAGEEWLGEQALKIVNADVNKLPAPEGDYAHSCGKRSGWRYTGCPWHTVCNPPKIGDTK